MNLDDPENAHGPNVVMTSSNHRIERGWTKIGYSVEHDVNKSHVTLHEGETSVGMFTLSDWVIYKHVGDGLGTSLGGHLGLMYSMKGFIYDFKYVQG